MKLSRLNLNEEIDKVYVAIMSGSKRPTYIETEPGETLHDVIAKAKQIAYHYKWDVVRIQTVDGKQTIVSWDHPWLSKANEQDYTNYRFTH